MNGFLQELVQGGIYKKSQGRITRQVTWAALAAGVALGFWQLGWSLIYEWHWNLGWRETFATVFPAVLTALGWWVAYRLVNYPRFADFLIAVEAEMNKVSWPTRGELARSSLVVLITIFLLAAVLFGFDALWEVVFRFILKVR